MPDELVLARQPGAPHTKTILIVEDHEETGQLLAEVLTSEGPSSPVVVESWSRALQVVTSLEVDLCMLDDALPDGNGLDLYDQLRAISAFGATPVLFLTAATITEQQQQAFLQRQLAVVAKPFDLETLLQAIAQHLLSLPPAQA